MPGFVKEPVKFRILKPVRGVPRSAYTTGVFPTRDRKMIAMLSRLPNDHVQRIPEDATEEAALEPVLEPEPEEVNLYPSEEEIEKLDWFALRRIGWARGVYNVKMKKPALVQAILEQSADVA